MHGASDSGMNGWIDVELAAAVTRRSVKTIRTWVNRGQVSAVCHRATRTVLVWWPHVYDRSTVAEYRAPRRPGG